MDVDARVEDEVDAALAAGVLDGREVGRLLGRVAQAAGGGIGVLEVAADRAGAEQAVHERRGREAVAGLAVGGHRHVDGRDDPPQRGEGLVGGEWPPSAYPSASATPTLVVASAGASAASALALAASHALRSTSGVPGRCSARSASARAARSAHGVSLAVTPSRVQALMVMTRKISAASSASEKCSAAAS